MHVLKFIRVDNFLGQKKPIEMRMNPDANFIIGRNGTGKTTLINLINAALNLDIDALSQTRFAKIEFRFQSDKRREVPSFVIERQADEAKRKIFVFIIKRSAKAEPEKFVIEDIPHNRHWHIYNEALELKAGKVRIHKKVSLHNAEKIKAVRSQEIRKQLDGIFQTSWLSLQRSADRIVTDDDDFEYAEYKSGVDNKLVHTLEKLSGYFSRLDNKVASQTLEFQKDWFLSFLTSKSSFLSTRLETIDFEMERQSIEAIFQKFGMKNASFDEKLSEHISTGEKSIKAVMARIGSPNKDDVNVTDFVDHFLVAVDVVRLHHLVEKWQVLQERQSDVYRPKLNFVEITTNMLFRKSIRIDDSNKVSVVSDKDGDLDTDKLSSGEKQLIIFLAETLLQEREPFIFLADEPELSLHVDWQEELVQSLMTINPNAQVVFATHSPDIVGKFQNNVFDMERLIN